MELQMEQELIAQHSVVERIVISARNPANGEVNYLVKVRELAQMYKHDLDIEGLTLGTDLGTWSSGENFLMDHRKAIPGHGQPPGTAGSSERIDILTLTVDSITSKEHEILRPCTQKGSLYGGNQKPSA